MYRIRFLIGQEADRYRCDCGVEGDELGMLSIVPEESENEDSNSVDDPSASAENNDRTTRSDEQSPPSVEVHDVVQVSDVTKQLADLKPVTPLSSSTQNNVSTYYPKYSHFFLVSALLNI